MNIKKELVEREEFSMMCVKCKKNIKGISPDQVLYNLRIHMSAKHDHVTDGSGG